MAKYRSKFSMRRVQWYSTKFSERLAKGPSLQDFIEQSSQFNPEEAASKPHLKPLTKKQYLD